MLKILNNSEASLNGDPVSIYVPNQTASLWAGAELEYVESWMRASMVEKEMTDEIYTKIKDAILKAYGLTQSDSKKGFRYAVINHPELRIHYGQVDSDSRGCILVLLKRNNQLITNLRALAPNLRASDWQWQDIILNVLILADYSATGDGNTSGKNEENEAGNKKKEAVNKKEGNEASNKKKEAVNNSNPTASTETANSNDSKSGTNDKDKSQKGGGSGEKKVVNKE